MTYSMTAFAQATISTELGELRCELRSVNHRFLEIAPRMPEELRAFEGDLRECISGYLARGRIDCYLRLNSESAVALELESEIIERLSALQAEVLRLAPEAQPLRVADMLRWPGALQAASANPDQLKADLLSVLEQALTSLKSARLREGGKMAELIRDRVSALRGIVDEVTQFLPELIEQQRERLFEKLGEFVEQLEPQRIEQEMLILMNKSDVAEELDRLKVHLNEIDSVLGQTKPAGRRLDFLMQELNREANTLGSKSNDARTTKASVDIKVLIEQMREQVQNIE